MADLAVVKLAIKDVDNLPKEASKMLLAGLTHAAQIEGSPHHFQASFLDMFDSTFQAAWSSAQNESVEAANAIISKDAEIEQKNAEKEAAEQAEKTVHAEYENKVNSLAELQKCYEIAQREHVAAERKGKSQLNDWNKLHNRHEQAVSFVQSTLTQLIDGTLTGEELEEAAVQTEKKLLDISEQVIASAAGKALRVTPENRQPFDAISIDACKSAFGAHIDALVKEVAENQKAETEFRAELLGDWAIAEIARERVEHAKLAKNEAQAADEMAMEVTREAKKAITVAIKAKSFAEREEISAQDKVAMFAKALDALGRLRAGPKASSEAEVGDVEMGNADADAEMKPATDVTDKIAAIDHSPATNECANRGA